MEGRKGVLPTLFIVRLVDNIYRMNENRKYEILANKILRRNGLGLEFCSSPTVRTSDIYSPNGGTK
jgi:hypothetical protein